MAPARIISAERSRAHADAASRARGGGALGSRKRDGIVSRHHASVASSSAADATPCGSCGSSMRWQSPCWPVTDPRTVVEKPHPAASVVKLDTAFRRTRRRAAARRATAPGTSRPDHRAALARVAEHHVACRGTRRSSGRSGRASTHAGQSTETTSDLEHPGARDDVSASSRHRALRPREVFADGVEVPTQMSGAGSTWRHASCTNARRPFLRIHSAVCADAVVEHVNGHPYAPSCARISCARRSVASSSSVRSGSRAPVRELDALGLRQTSAVCNGRRRAQAHRPSSLSGLAEGVDGAMRERARRFSAATSSPSRDVGSFRRAEATQLRLSSSSRATR